MYYFQLLFHAPLANSLSILRMTEKKSKQTNEYVKNYE